MTFPSPQSVLTAVVAVCLAAGLLATFVKWERLGRRVDVVVVLVLVLVADATLYPNTEASRAVGLFHPYIAGQSFRLIQLLIAVALMARVIASGLPRRLLAAESLWLAFFVWYATSCVVGLLDGNDPKLVLARGFFILEAGGMLALTAGVPVDDLLGDRGIRRLTRWCGALAAGLIVTTELGIQFTTTWPGIPLVSAGEVGSNLATIFISLGVLGLASEMGRRRRSPTVLLAATALLLAHLVSSQRAARLGLAVVLITFLLVLLLPRGRPRPFSAGDAAALLAVILAAVSVPLLVWSITTSTGGSPLNAYPFLDRTLQAVDTGYRQGSVESRFNEWAEALPLIRDRPVFGNGVGTTFDHHDVGKDVVIRYDITNNLILDLLLRAGAVGLIGFTLAWVATCRLALLVWRRGRDQVALLAVAAGCALAGMVAKAMVESIINEYRMTVLIGLLAGVVFSAGRAMPVRSGPTKHPESAGRDDGTDEAGPEACAPPDVHRRESSRQIRAFPDA